ncbi:TIGR00730 family Rossman fold protein [Lactobacillus paragasseri]|uniref:LOG family protein n=1 Tax=Lactobacillus paragasseri TaxID=2107999 RepID=UPI0012E1FF82|nr:TIGR00730 family Rossman fold protein [Lactobacillus paragasseri]MDK8086521.1 TIGR00730 family Rossman fold protein [Lactobacillus paragasseri]MDX5118050.1 TIGR00730 family Rossman fold protein [Lactobacillus paragasseri]MDX5121931.1 TIGR00730 family Rossman fold protein [Lactobacillus paragasseri]QGT97258.1 TIGR00730 family Rossman fold protein [Lactobacillus paragasseri]UWI47138.1 TIGR00730 family Rossman fold protein [Lactobacillus paragasseri]
MIRKIAVYCGARSGNRPEYAKAAYEFGKKMADHQIELVYGGGKYGLMRAVADGVLENGGIVHGIITEELKDRGAAYEKVQDFRVVENMDRRKDVMMKLADGMVALPGSIGTLEEISQAISWTAIGDNAKPVAFYNYDGFYDNLDKLLKRMNKDDFLEDIYLDTIYFETDFDKILQFMKDYQAPAYRKY